MKVIIKFIGSPFYNFCKAVADIIYIAYIFSVITLAIALLPVKYLLASIGWLFGIEIKGIAKIGMFSNNKITRLLLPCYRVYFYKHYSLAI